MSVLQIKNFTAGYLIKPVIRDLNVEALPCGKVTMLLGPNGSGKSTLLRGLAGLVRAKGQLVLNGVDLMKLPFAQRSKKVSYLQQSLPEGVHLTVLESVIVAERTESESQSYNLDAIYALLQRLGIEHLALSYLEELSGGQKQLVGLAQLLIRHPEVLLLDEPLSALDLYHQYQVIDLIKTETQKRKLTTVVVVHDINTALRHADHVLLLKKGELVASGKPYDVITSDTVSQVYNVSGRIESCSQGIPQIVIDGLIAQAI